MKVLINGIGGFMGKEVEKLCKAGANGAQLFGGVDPNLEESNVDGVVIAKAFSSVPDGCDVIIDFSHHSCTMDLTKYAIEKNLPLVLATTGQTEEEKQAILDASKKIPVFFAANYSIGVTLLIQLAKNAAKSMPNAEIEIVEVHHDRKLDAPSGTALAIANGLKEVRPEAEITCGRSGQSKRTPNEIGIQSVRIGNVVGEHEVLIGTQNETITLKHSAHSRALFAEGAIAAAAFLVDKQPGLYDMNSLIKF